jgi:hypothetical protein
MCKLDRDAVARALYELDPYVAPPEYLGCERVGVVQLVGGGAYSWEQALEADAAFGGLAFYEPLTAEAYRMADAALAVRDYPPRGAVGEFAIAWGGEPHGGPQLVLPLGR